jgi:GntR family histidine utilization transcriptional repressor
MAGTRVTWRAVRDRIHARILNGTYQPGDRLPRDLDIAQDLDCARTTVQRAMQDLSDAGLVERRRRGGTRVRPNPVTRAVLDIPVTRAEVEAQGGTYGYELVRQAREMTPNDVAATMELTRPRDLLRIEALHLANGQPYLFEDRWVCPETVPEILEVDLSRQSANEWLVMNNPYDRCDLKFYAEAADEALAEILRAEPGAALLVIERTTWIGGAPITTVKSVTRPGYRLLTRS